MKAYSCERCKRFVTGTPCNRIATVTAMLGDKGWELAVNVVIMTELGEEPDLCPECRRDILDMACPERKAR